MDLTLFLYSIALSSPLMFPWVFFEDFLFFPSADRQDNDRTGNRHEPAHWGVGAYPGVWCSTQASLWAWVHWYPQPGQQLLPQFCDAGAVQYPRLPEKVSELNHSSPLVWDQYKELGASVAVIVLRTAFLPDEDAYALDCSILFCRYVDKLEKIFQSAPSDPTQDFSTQVYVEFWWEKEGWGCLDASPPSVLLCSRVLPQASLLFPCLSPETLILSDQ